MADVDAAAEDLARLTGLRAGDVIMGVGDAEVARSAASTAPLAAAVNAAARIFRDLLSNMVLLRLKMPIEI